MKTIGILGGMGPVATCEYFNRILKLCQERHGAVQDGEYPAISIYSLSLKGSNESGIKNEKVLEREFVEGFRELSKTKCDFITIPCNTAHHFIDTLRKEVSTPIISITDETVDRVKKKGLKKIGLLASESTYEHGVYKKPLAVKGIEIVEPTDKEKKQLTKIVLHAMGNTIARKDKLQMLKITSRMKKEDNVQAIIIGCTELSLVLKTAEYPILAIDSLDVLAQAAVDLAYG